MDSVSRADLIREYQRLADELGEKPTLDQFNDGNYSSTPVYKHFDSFTALKEAAGYDHTDYKVPEQELIQDLRRVADEIGRSPPVEVYREYGNYNFKTLKRRWGSWHDVLDNAGLEPTTRSKDYRETGFDGKSDGNIIVECDYCGEGTRKHEYRVEKQENVYCDMSCKGAAMSEQTGEDARSYEGGYVDIECEICGEVNTVRPAKAEKSRFCSQECMLEWRSDYLKGENHPRYTGNPEYRYYGPNWDEQAQQCRERDNMECQICGLTNQACQEKWGERLTAHHIIKFYDFESYERANELPNLIASCKECHGYLEAGRAALPPVHRERFLDWVATIDKEKSDATARI